MNRAQTLSDLAVPSPSFRVAQWRMLLAAMFCYLFFYTGRQTFGFAIPGIQAEFGLTKETLGWISAAMLWLTQLVRPSTATLRISSVADAS